MLAFLFIAQTSLSEFAKRFPLPPPPSAKALLAPEIGGLKRKSIGYYSKPLLTSVLGGKTAAYLTCGARDATVARYEGEHVLVVGVDRPECMFEIDSASDTDAACAGVKQRIGVSTVVARETYIRIRGHEDVVGGGADATKLACALAAEAAR